MPKNVIPLTEPGFTPARLKYRVYSSKWGLLRDNRALFADAWQRLRAAAKVQNLSRDGRKRLEWMI